MSILDEIVEVGPEAPRITIYGKGGIGKSTFASKFPAPIFLLTEKNALIGAKAFPIARSLNDLIKNIKKLLTEKELPFKTVVLDSVSKLDHLVISHILDEEKPDKNGKKPASLNTACGGYGAGFAKAQRIHRYIKDLMDGFQDKGIAVVYILHNEIKKYKSPETEDYDVYTLTLNHDKSREVYTDDVDCVAFCKQKAFIDSTESGRTLVRSSDECVMYVGPSEGHVSKNRYQMPNELPLDYDTFVSYIPFYNNKEEK